MFVIFFFKQKTAYEMRISDWSSDVCSSDLKRMGAAKRLRIYRRSDRKGIAWPGRFAGDHTGGTHGDRTSIDLDGRGYGLCRCASSGQVAAMQRSEERRVGKECVRTFRSRWSPHR